MSQHTVKVLMRMKNRRSSQVRMAKAGFPGHPRGSLWKHTASLHCPQGLASTEGLQTSALPMALWLPGCSANLKPAASEYRFTRPNHGGPEGRTAK